MTDKIVGYKYLAPIRGSVRMVTKFNLVDVPDPAPFVPPNLPIATRNLPDEGGFRLAAGRDERWPELELPVKRLVVLDCGSIVPAVQVRTTPTAWIMDEDCPYDCGQKHHHSPEAGHRVAHCPSPPHPMSRMGYYLLPPGWQR